jgi:hypothetical protein
MRTGNQLYWPSVVLLGLLIGGSSTSLNTAVLQAHDPQAKVLAQSTVAGAASAVVPDGWRRTRHGWEHTSTWTNLFANASINELIEIQRRREPAWVRYGFAKLRAIPPLMVAVLQIAAIAVIVSIAESRRQAEKTLNRRQLNLTISAKKPTAEALAR